jgi:ferredoxin
MKNDGLAYVQEGDKIFSALDNNPQGAEGQAEVPKGLEDLVVEAAEECPGECIFVVP